MTKILSVQRLYLFLPFLVIILIKNLLIKGKNKPNNKTENHRKVNNCRTIIERNIEFPNINA
ncbi:hypothetical protein [Spiroplasma endosymbiont of Polydrusus formosus]|uniref:hypothetical protein n=1 Tax=Spiroplasma endosymbiont of Polydrusus formosus TaxID=3139326 RepID=UPI0035B55888